MEEGIWSARANITAGRPPVSGSFDLLSPGPHSTSNHLPVGLPTRYRLINAAAEAPLANAAAIAINYDITIERGA